MVALLSLLFAATQPVPPPTVQFDRITLTDAVKLNGAVVAVEFRVGRPSYTWPLPLRTVTGPAEVEGEDQERTVVLRGDRLGDLKDGKRVKAVGTVRVLHHEEARVGNVTVPAWDEIRFEER